MVTLFDHESQVTDCQDTFEQAVKKIKDTEANQVNEIYPVYKLFCKCHSDNSRLHCGTPS